MSYIESMGATFSLASAALRPTVPARAPAVAAPRTAPPLQLATVRAAPSLALAALKPPAQIQAELAARQGGAVKAGMGVPFKLLLAGSAVAAVYFLFLRKKPGNGPIVGKTIAMRSIAKEGV
jgi:hypothetical protein